MDQLPVGHIHICSVRNSNPHHLANKANRLLSVPQRLLFRDIYGTHSQNLKFLDPVVRSNIFIFIDDMPFATVKKLALTFCTNDRKLLFFSRLLE